MNQNVEQWEIRKSAVSSERGIVAAQNWLAAAAGTDALARGGNAVDAAVACAFALCAVEPWMCGLGGSGYFIEDQGAAVGALDERACRARSHHNSYAHANNSSRRAS